MAKPAFIYAFDNLGPYRFTELCGELLGSQYRGFMLGGEGADGGIDAEIDKVLGIWQPEYKEALLTDIVLPGQTVVFQFKHKVAARLGQAQTRTQLLKFYKCRKSKKCELHSKLIQGREPASYVLVTNVEVNSQFRDTFRNQCKNENPSIQNYQVIGLDELVSWVEMMPELRQLYFPTIFGMPRFDLRINVLHSFELLNPEDLSLMIDVMNVGSMPSYLNESSIKFFFIIEGKQEGLGQYLGNNPLIFINTQSGITLEPGRKYTYLLPQHYFAEVKKYIEKHFKTKEKMLPTEIQIRDEIGNTYHDVLEEDQRNMILGWMYNE